MSEASISPHIEYRIILKQSNFVIFPLNFHLHIAI